MPRTFAIHTIDDPDPTEVEKCEHELAGVRYTDPGDGHQVFVPWWRVEQIRSYRTPDEPPVAADIDAPVPVEAEPAAPEGTGETEPDETEPDGKGGKASEWAETDPAAVREWAKDQGLTVSDSGPISKAVLSKYAAAHSD